MECLGGGGVCVCKSDLHIADYISAFHQIAYCPGSPCPQLVQRLLLHVTLTLLHREFGRWRVNSLALERQESTGVAAPLDPEFIHNIRQLGRRPTLQKITDNIIKKYGTHFLLSATLGGTD